MGGVEGNIGLIFSDWLGKKIPLGRRVLRIAEVAQADAHEAKALRWFEVNAVSEGQGDAG